MLPLTCVLCRGVTVKKLCQTKIAKHVKGGGGTTLIFSSIMIFELGPGTKSLVPKDHFKPILRKISVFRMGAPGRNHIWAYFTSLKIKQIAIF